MKNIDNNDVIEVGESDEEEEEDMARIKWKYFEVHHMITIRDKMDKECVKTTITQGIIFKT